MGFFEQIFGTELGLPTRAVVALVLVLALIALTVWLMRRFGDGRIVTQTGGRGHQQRLAVLDKATVDARRRLVLIRRDNVEHLILIGGPTDVVVEQNIVRAAPATSTVRPATRPAEYEAEITSLTAQISPKAVPQSAPQVLPDPAPPAAEPAPAARPAQKLDPQYAEMALDLEAALGKPTPAPAPDAPRAPAPEQRAPEPRVTERPAQPAQGTQPARAPMPRIPETRPPEPWFDSPRTQAAQTAQPLQPAPKEQAPADVFASLEEEMASLLRPGGRKDPQK